MLTTAFAQQRQPANTRSLQGIVSSAEGAPIDQAVVQLKDTKTLAIRSFITRQDGSYHFHGLSTDTDYEVRAENKGATSDSKTLSSFDSRKEAVINLKLGKK
jgi:hypothetical protein